MNYKVVRNSDNEIVAFGPNDDSYEPTIKTNEKLSFENETPVLNNSHHVAQVAARKSALAKLSALGLSGDEIKALVGE